MTGAAESLGAWLDRQLATVPQDLAVRVRAAIPETSRSAPSAEGPDILAAAAASELRHLLERGCETRWAAPGLLTVDALISYACELLAGTGADMETGTEDIVRRIVAVLPGTGAAA